MIRVTSFGSAFDLKAAPSIIIIPAKLFAHPTELHLLHLKPYQSNYRLISSSDLSHDGLRGFRLLGQARRAGRAL